MKTAILLLDGARIVKKETGQENPFVLVRNMDQTIHKIPRDIGNNEVRITHHSHFTDTKRLHPQHGRL